MRITFGACTGVYTVGSVTAGSFTVTPALAAAPCRWRNDDQRADYRGKWSGALAATPTQTPGDDSVLRWRLTRTGGGWLADGFLEGQWVKVCDGFGHCAIGKIQNIRGTNAAHDEQIEFGLSLWGDSFGSLVGPVTVTRIAAQAVFTTANWMTDQRIELQGDTGYYQPLIRQGVKTFPATQHLLTRLRGPLAVEGGVTGADRSLELGLKLPGEQDGPLFAIAPQAPESKQIDVLNIYGDSSVANNWGVMTSTTLRGLGMAKDLDFGASYGGAQGETFGEPQIFPGGISFGSVSFDGTAYSTDAGKSTIEVINLFLGSGNDRLDVQGTLQPDVPVKAVGTVVVATQGPGTGIPSGTTHRLSRAVPFDFKAQGFLVGQTVTVSQGGHVTRYLVKGFGDDNPDDTTANTVMYLAFIDDTACRDSGRDGHGVRCAGHRHRSGHDHRRRGRRHGDAAGRQLHRRRIRGRTAGAHRRHRRPVAPGRHLGRTAGPSPSTVAICCRTRLSRRRTCSCPARTAVSRRSTAAATRPCRRCSR